MKSLPSILAISLALALGASADIYIAFHNGGVTVNGMAPGNNPTAMGTIVDTSANTWNNVANNGGVGLSFTGFALLDSAGTATTATVDATSGFTNYNNNGWGGTTKDRVMMEGWYGFRDAEFLTINNLPADLTSGGYSVIIYGDPGVVRTMDYFVDGKQRTIESTAVFDGTFTSGSNVTVFGGLTAPSITITGNTTSAGRSAINGLQIIAGDLAVLDIASFTASGLFVAPGTSVTLDWEITGADRITLDPGMLDVTGTTTTDVTVNEETTYTLTATDDDEPASLSKALTIRTAPVINLFEVVQRTARDSADVRLVWDTLGASTLAINDGSTDVFTSSDPAEIASGSTTLAGISADTTFTLTATFPGGSPATAQSSIDIRSGADPFSLEETVLADGPLAYYRFEESSPSAPVLLDHSPHGRDSLALSPSGVSPGQPGAVGAAWDFDRGSVELDLNPDPSLGDISISLVARIDAPVTDGGTHSLASQQNSTAGDGRSLVQVATADGNLSSWLGDMGRQNFGVAPVVGDWCHITFVYDHADSEFRFHVNGTLESTIPGLTAGTTIGNYILAANKGQATEFLRGALDEVALFDFQLDDPDGNGDPADSRIPAHYAAYLRDASPLLGFSASATEITAGASIELSWKAGDAATSIVIDNGIGDVTPLTNNGAGSTTVKPVATTTYTITVNGTITREITVTVNRPVLITAAGFNGSGAFEVTAVNLVEGRQYDLFYSFDIASFTPIGSAVTADGSGTATFVDVLANPINEPDFFYRVGEVGNPLIP